MTEFLLSHIQSSLFYELAALMLLAGVLGFIGQKLRQPLIVVFIGVGLLAGPDVMGIVVHQEEHHNLVEILAELGISLLLFMVGLKLNPEVIRTMGVMALITGIAQVTLSTIIGAGLCLLLGFDMRAAVICGLGLAFSSTIIVVKLLSDQREIESLYGKMALGILIVQDLVVIITVVAMSGFSSEITPTTQDLMGQYGMTGLKLVGITLVIWIFTKYFADGLAHALSRSSELTVIFAIGFSAAMAALSDSLGLSKELGGLLAGISLAPTAFRTSIYARLSSLRDFLLLFFFIGLGTQLSFENIGDQIILAAGISLFVLIAKPLIIMGIMAALGYRKRTCFQTGIVLSQISEFSLILSAVALSAGFLSAEQFNIMTLTGMMTIGLSTYLTLSSAAIYRFFEKPLALFERSRLREGDFTSKIERDYDVILYGLGRYGTAMARHLQQDGARILGVDFDPDSVRKAQESGIPAIYGDAADPEFPSFLPLETAHTIVLCIPLAATSPLIADTRHSLSKGLRTLGFKGRIAVISHQRERDGNGLPQDLQDLSDLADLDVDIVLRPYQDAAEAGARQILDLRRP